MEKLDHGALDELGFHFAPQVVLFTALKLGIFPAIEGGAKNVSSVASAIGCSERGVRMVLDCMVAMGLLAKQTETGTERYDLNPLSRKYFLTSSEDYVGDVFSYCDRLMKLWLTVPEAARTGRPTLSIFTDEEKEKLNTDIAGALFRVHRAYAWRLVEVLEGDATFLSGRGGPVRILDVAAGSAVWSIPFALRFEGAEVTAIDLGPVLELAERYTQQFGVRNRYRFIGADLRQIEFEKEAYDLALLGHICHSEGAEWSQRLIANCFRALKKTGRLLIMDYVPDEKRRSHLVPLLLALNCLLGTEEGDTFTFTQFEEWLLNAGFNEVRTVPVNGHSPIIVGLKT